MLKTGLIFIFINAIVCFSQEKIFVPTDTIQGNFDNFSVDNFGRIYLTKEDVIEQFIISTKQPIYSTSLKTLRPTSIESSKSFRTLIFDQERAVVYFFDNTLTDLNGEINLFDVGVQQPWLVCESFGGNTFWVLDGGVMQLMKLNRELNVVTQTDNLVNLFGYDEQPSQMIEHNDFLYILIPNKGVAIFDVFGTFIKMYPTTAQTIGAFGNYLLLRSNNTIEAVSNKSFLETDFTYNIPPNTTAFYFSTNAVYFLTNEGLIVGKYQ